MTKFRITSKNLRENLNKILFLATLTFFWIQLAVYFYLTVIAPYNIISNKSNNIVILAGGIIMYLLFLFFTVEYTYTTFAKIYNFKRKSLFAFFLFEHFLTLGYSVYTPIFTDHEDEAKLKIKETYLASHPLLVIAASFLSIVYAFAIVYYYIGTYHPEAFKSPVKFSDAFYFSLTSITVGPSGLEPSNVLSQSFVMVEIMLGVFYSLLVLSAIASFFRNNEQVN